MRLAAALCLCAYALGASVAAPQAVMTQKAEPGHKTTYYLHARIYTNDPKMPWASALAVRDEKIFCVGTIAHIMLDCGGAKPEAEIYEMHGRFMMPGFNDAHTHLGSAGRDKLALDLKGTDSLEELQQRLRSAVAQHKPGEWIVGSGWDQTRWPDKKFPNRQDLDAAAPDNPVFLVHISGHVGVANSMALKRTEILPETKNPQGGQIERDADGNPTGMLMEASAMEFVQQKIPDPTAEQRRHGIELVLQELAANGVTSAQDNSDWDDFLVYHDLREEKKLTVRITEWLPFMAPVTELQDMRAEGGTTDPWLKTGALKMVTDGALGSRTAAMIAPYSDDPNTSGILTIEPEKLKAMALERDKLGFQLAFHAIGDRANRVALDTFESVLRVNGTRDRRDRVEHAQVVAPEDISRFGLLNVIASMQPSHQTNDMRWAEERVGPERIKGAYAWNSLQKAGAVLAFGTDYDVEPINPFRGLYACVSRESADGGPAGGWQPQEKLPLDACIHAYTSGSAYAQFEEGKKGELKAGEYADFIVLTQDLTKATPKEILNTEVLQTVVGGRTVFQKK